MRFHHDVTLSVSMLAAVATAACSSGSGTSAGTETGNGADSGLTGSNDGSSGSSGDASTDGGNTWPYVALCDTMDCSGITAGVTGFLRVPLTLTAAQVEACGLCEYNLLAKDCSSDADASIPSLTTSSTSVGAGTCFLELLVECQTTASIFAPSVASLTGATLSNLCTESSTTAGCFPKAVSLDSTSGSYDCAPH